MEKVGVAGYEKVAVDGAEIEGAAIGALADGGQDCGDFGVEHVRDTEVSEGAFEALVIAVMAGGLVGTLFGHQ